MSEEIRWYRGKYKVKVVLKRKKPKGVKHYPVTWLVEALEYIPLSRGQFRRILIGEQFTTIPRLLWKHPKEVEQK